MFSDGYMDQFGSKDGRKFKELITTIHQKPLSEQKLILNSTLDTWLNKKYGQTDDILIVGLEI